MVGFILVAVGLFVLAGSAFNWDWYWERRRTQLWVDLFGRTGARIFYAALGAVVLVGGVLIVAGVITFN
jgi:hypothetical protein